MKIIALLFLILFLSLIQATFLPLNLLLVFVIILSLWQEAPQSFLWVFLAGLCLDLFSLKQLGLSSIIFVSFDFLIKIYRQRFSLEQPLVVSLFFVLSYFLFSLITAREMKIWEGVVLLVILLLIRFLRKDWFFVSSGQEGGRLKL
jgi:cell shape-determining protein MreD